VDETFRLITGGYPAKDMSLTAVMSAIILGWDASRVAISPARDCARLGLCHIGLRWHPLDKLPYTFEDISRKLVEITPELNGVMVSPGTMQSMLHPRPGMRRRR
jgi:hypothetical protein